jgi:hypothetical protein
VRELRAILELLINTATSSPLAHVRASLAVWLRQVSEGNQRFLGGGAALPGYQPSLRPPAHSPQSRERQLATKCRARRLMSDVG